MRAWLLLLLLLFKREEREREREREREIDIKTNGDHTGEYYNFYPVIIF